MRSLLSDVRFALRLMRRGPAFFSTLLAVLVAGIAATTAMFSIVESLLLKPLPYPHPEQLTVVFTALPEYPEFATSMADFIDLRAGGTTFEAMAATQIGRFNLSSEGAKPESVKGASVTGDFFTVMGIQPLRGRLLTPEDDRLGAPPVAVVSASLWREHFASDPGLVGRSILLDGRPYVVVGIAPEWFRLASVDTDGRDVWTPLAVTHVDTMTDIAKHRGSHYLGVIGRRRAGVSLEQARAQLSAVAHRLAQQYPDSNTKSDVTLFELHDALVGPLRSSVWVLFAAVALVFLIVCSNVANLLLTRAQSRRGEMAARAALGATPVRLARQVVTETVVVFLLGALGGSILARWLVDLFASGLIDGAAATIAVGVDPVALFASAATCLVCGLVFGLVPALALARVEPQAVLKDSSARAGVGRSQRNIRSGLVVAQVALACVLLVGSGLALKAFARVASRSPGFDAHDVATARILLPETDYGTADRQLAFYRDAMARIAAQPGVQSVAGAVALPMSGDNPIMQFSIEGRPPWRRGEEPNMGLNVVTPTYFDTLGIRLLRGRAFVDGDRKEGRHVAILSQSAAERFFPGSDAIGQRITVDDEAPFDWLEIVGVVGDVRRNGLAEPVKEEFYLPFAQSPDRGLIIVARSARASALLQTIPALVAEVDPRLAVSGRRLMTERVAESIGGQRYVAMLLAAFAAAALLLATLGVFGVVSYVTSQRSHELGIRMALGSTPGGVVGLVVQGGVRLVAAGLVIGLLGAVVVGRLLGERVPEVAALDLTVYGVIPVVLGAAGMLACLLPAWRAVRIPPASALRYE